MIEILIIPFVACSKYIIFMIFSISNDRIPGQIKESLRNVTHLNLYLFFSCVHGNYSIIL